MEIKPAVADVSLLPELASDLRGRAMKKILLFFKNFDLAISIFAMTVITGNCFMGVIMRYIFNRPIVWLEEISMALIIWSVFFAAGYAFRTNNHVSVELLVEYLPRKLRWIIEVFVFIVVILTLCFFGFTSFKLVVHLFDIMRVTNILKIPYWIIYLPIPISSVLMIINYTLSSIKDGYILGRNYEEGREKIYE
ncbi:MAG: TRAP transporter small permease [Holosporales bacterium]|nr:TRAP transporter small permease [Holosporales bacterium]